MYYTYSLSALLLPLRWIISSTCPLHQCTLCASYSMRIVKWISICGMYVRAWLGDASISRMQVSVNYSMAYCSINTIVIYIYMLLHYINTIVVQVVCQLQHGYTTLILLLYKLYKLMPDSMECVYVHKQMSLNRA